jgi:hypothetical protein
VLSISSTSSTIACSLPSFSASRADSIRSYRRAVLRGAGIQGADDEWEWSVDHAARAEEALFGLIRIAYKGRQLAPSYRWDPVAIPEVRPQPTALLSAWDSYRKDAWMGPCDRSIDLYARFDSETAELRLARKLDTWSDVSHG